jgi:Tfp pilus assembly protein PilO
MKMNFIKVHKKYLLMSAVIWAVCLVIFLIAYVFVIGPQKSSKRLIENKLAEKRKTYEFAIKASQDETKIQLNEQIESLHNELKDFVADFEDSASLTFDLSQIAEEKEVASFGSKVKSNRGIAVKKDNYKFINENKINITFTGNFNQFATFLNALERHRPVIFIEKFSLIPSSGQKDSGFRVNLNVTAFVRKQQDSGTANKSTTQVYGKKI